MPQFGSHWTEARLWSWRADPVHASAPDALEYPQWHCTRELGTRSQYGQGPCRHVRPRVSPRYGADHRTLYSTRLSPSQGRGAHVPHIRARTTWQVPDTCVDTPTHICAYLPHTHVQVYTCQSQGLDYCCAPGLSALCTETLMCIPTHAPLSTHTCAHLHAHPTQMFVHTHLHAHITHPYVHPMCTPTPPLISTHLYTCITYTHPRIPTPHRARKVLSETHFYVHTPTCTHTHLCEHIPTRYTHIYL